MKTVKDQSQKQMKVIKNNKQLDSTNEHSYKYKLSFSVEREIFTNIYINTDKTEALISKALIDSYIVMMNLFQ